MQRILLVLVLLGTTAYAGDERMNLALGAGIDVGSSAGWAIRMGETVDMAGRDDGFIYGGTCGYDYWHASDRAGFSIPVGGFVGARVQRITTTLGGGVGLLAFEKIHDTTVAGVVPYVAATLGFELDETRTVTIDARASRHVVADASDVTRWSVLLMIGKTLGR